MSSYVFHVSFFFILLLLQSHAESCTSDTCNKQKYVVYLGAKGEEAETYSLTSLHYDLLTSVLGSQEQATEAMAFSYKYSFSGFSAWLTSAQAQALSRSPEVVSVFQSKMLQVQTTRSWNFIGLNASNSPTNSWPDAGEDIIIGVFDTGIWPESVSFSDYGMKPVPARWKGACVNTVKNETEKIHCNKKLIGARFYIDEAGSARDYNGHGTHTSSTAAGRLVAGESLFGLGKGDARGGLPRARIAMYKVCDVNGGCSDDAILAAFDDAVHDGVDVLSLSIGGFVGIPFENDSIAIGSFHATEKGIIVSCAAGNNGPDASTVSNAAPWILTAGASTIDRTFAVSVELSNGKTVQATGLSLNGTVKNARIFSGLQAMSESGTPKGAQFCDTGDFDPKKVKGSVIVCLYPQIASRNTVIANLMDMEAAGVILGSISRGNVIYHFNIPGGTVPMVVYDEILTYLNSTSNLTVSIAPTTTVYGITAPTVAGFSSRGPSLTSPDILKPDFTAPGVNILASWSPASAIFYENDDTPVYAPSNIVSGTSMACPHVTGAAAFVKSVHPAWSPAAVRSALLTTAKFLDNTNSAIKDADGKVATYFMLGAGDISPMEATSPGLIYDITTEEYVSYLCASGKYDMKKLKLITGRQNVTCAARADLFSFHLNYPSISVPALSSKTYSNVSRTVTNVGAHDSVYSVTVSAPPGVAVTVEPSQLRFTSIGQKLSFVVHMTINTTLENWVFGSLTWSDGYRNVRTPLALK